MAKQSPIRFGAIGPGGAGTCRIRELAAHPLGLQVVAAVDPQPDRLDNLQKCIGYDFARYTGQQDFKKMIDECELDAVGIFTPHSLHLEHVEYAIAKGLHVLIEKPMVYGAANAMRVYRAMEASGKVGIVHYQRHYEPQYIKARELIKKGVIGDVKTFFVYMAQDWPGRAWRGEPEFSCGGQVNDSGSHYQDILLWMTGLVPKSAEGHRVVVVVQPELRRMLHVDGDGPGLCVSHSFARLAQPFQSQAPGAVAPFRTIEAEQGPRERCASRLQRRLRRLRGGVRLQRLWGDDHVHQHLAEALGPEQRVNVADPALRSCQLRQHLDVACGEQGRAGGVGGAEQDVGL